MEVRALNIFLLIIISIATLVGIFFGLLLIILGCAIWNSWWGLFALTCYLLAPIPDFLGKFISGVRGSGIDEIFVDKPSVPMCEHFGSFFTALIATFGLGVNFILFHNDAIGVGTFILQIVGGVVIGLSIITGLVIYRIISFRTQKTSSF